MVVTGILTSAVKHRSRKTVSYTSPLPTKNEARNSWRSAQELSSPDPRPQTPPPSPVAPPSQPRRSTGAWRRRRPSPKQRGNSWQPEREDERCGKLQDTPSLRGEEGAMRSTQVKGKLKSSRNCSPFLCDHNCFSNIPFPPIFFFLQFLTNETMTRGEGKHAVQYS